MRKFYLIVSHLKTWKASTTITTMASTSASSPRLPPALVFDLDGCVWDPEMYEMWGSGGSPFTPVKSGDLKGRDGTIVRLLGDVREIFREFATDPKWNRAKICIASRCDEPSWARECIQKFSLGGNLKLKDVFDENLTEIYKALKSQQLKAISKKCGIPLKEMIFFDNEYGNCQDVAKAGATVVYTPDGVTRELFQQGLDTFPSPGEIINKGNRRRGYW